MRQLAPTPSTGRAHRGPRRRDVWRITCALGNGAATAVQALFAEAGRRGARTPSTSTTASRLWSWEEAAPILRDVAPRVDILLASRHDLEHLLDREDDADCARAARDRAFGHNAVNHSRQPRDGDGRMTVTVRRSPRTPNSPATPYEARSSTPSARRRRARRAARRHAGGRGRGAIDQAASGLRRQTRPRRRLAGGPARPRARRRAPGAAMSPDPLERLHDSGAVAIMRLRDHGAERRNGHALARRRARRDGATLDDPGALGALRALADAAGRGPAGRRDGATRRRWPSGGRGARFMPEPALRPCDRRGGARRPGCEPVPGAGTATEVAAASMPARGS